MLGLQPATRQAQMGWILEELSLSDLFHFYIKKNKISKIYVEYENFQKWVSITWMGDMT